jgi:hypothetical protein
MKRWSTSSFFRTTRLASAVSERSGSVVGEARHRSGHKAIYIYLADGEETIRAHSGLGGIPVGRIPRSRRSSTH